MALRYQLLALDMDGTLLNPYGEVSARDSEAVAAAVSAGVRVVLASGRAPRHMVDVHRQLNLQTPLVAFNGALIYDVARDEVIYHQPIDLDVTRRIAQLLKEHDPAINLHVETQRGAEDRWNVEAIDERLLASIQRWKVEPPHTVGEIQALLSDEATRVSKLWFYAPADTMAAIKGRLMADLREHIATLEFDDVTLTVLSTGVSKAAGVAWLAERGGIPCHAVMAIGDDLNDVPMLGWAGLGVAMGNARSAAREVATHVTASNAEHGVALAIERWALGQVSSTSLPVADDS